MTNSFFIIKELILADFKELSRNTKDIVWTIFVPLVLTLLLGLTFGADYMQFALPGLLAISIMFLCLFGLTVSIVWEREIKIYRRLRVTPIKLSQIITAKIVVFIILGLVQMSILMFIVGWFWGVSMKIHLYLLVSMLLTIFVFSTMGFVITAFSGDMQSGCNIVNILGFSMLYLGGALFPLDASHFALRALSMINPLRYVRDIFYVTLYNPNSLNLTSVNVIAILGFGLIFLVVSLWKFRWDVLS